MKKLLAAFAAFLCIVPSHVLYAMTTSGVPEKWDALDTLKLLYNKIKESIDAFQAQFKRLNITAFRLDPTTNSYLQRLFTMLTSVADFAKQKFGSKAWEEQP